MDVNFSQICSASQACWDALHRHVDFCGSQDRSYEFPDCSMPAGCLPNRALLGFSRQRDGYYLLYWRPAVDYIGSSRVLYALFQRNIWRFPNFEAMADRLQSLSWELGRTSSESRCDTLPTPTSAPGSRTASAAWPSLYLRLAGDLRQSVLGQERAVAATAFRLYGHIGKHEPARPLSLVFYGPTGVGKSELGKALAPALGRCSGRRYQFVWTDLNTFTQPHSVHRLIGAPPGYVGYDDQPVFEVVRQAPYTVFMFDELEKAHPEVLKVFMSILDEGRCTAHRPDDVGERELDFRRCVFVFTTNADLTPAGMRPMGFSPAQEDPPATMDKKAATPAELAEQLFLDNESARRAMVRSGVLTEIAGRFSGFVRFHTLDEASKLAVMVKQITTLGREYGLRIARVDPSTARALVAGRDGALSARSLVSVLEGVLTPAFIQASSAGPKTFRLSGLPGDLQLIPDQPISMTSPVSTSSL